MKKDNIEDIFDAIDEKYAYPKDPDIVAEMTKRINKQAFQYKQEHGKFMEYAVVTQEEYDAAEVHVEKIYTKFPHFAPTPGYATKLGINGFGGFIEIRVESESE
ncbi:hypothetical protein CPT_Mater140 [Bacillus phage Mater]|uniref:Uncharacterized protein n=1 Tax=Bacillus phage Mater TaxID=1540090 RepID=A0A0A0RMT8_9CAUD|nr:hypothetical protein CPT_Mater140 [Bacillus phage Mater]AIW03297.1 hypothetical protein CPT_Mater140 [Bacillus phage Mater]